MADSIKYFDPIEPTSKFPICGMPIRLDSYKTCTFGCQYCFSNGRKFGGGENVTFQIGNAQSVKNRLKKIFDDKETENFIFIDSLIANDYAWHCGGMSDPFQPCEQQYRATENIINITNDYNRHIVFSTKSDTTYNVPINPQLHSFQLSVTNVEDRRDLELNIPPIQDRLKFFYSLKEKGFLVGIRIQPFIPGISDIKIFEMFKDADHFILEGIKMVANNLEQRQQILELTGLQATDFKNYGLLNLIPSLRIKEYTPIIEWLESNNKSYSIADNDLHYLGNNTCCCGDNLTFHLSTNFNSTYLSHVPEPRISYTLDEIYKNLQQSKLLDCNCKHVFFSSNQGGCTTVKEFYDAKYKIKTSVFSPQYFYTEPEALALITKDLSYLQHIHLKQDIIEEQEEKKEEEEKQEPEQVIKQITQSIQISTPSELKQISHYFGWICTKCNTVFSPAIPFCLNCNHINKIDNNNFVPYWNK